MKQKKLNILIRTVGGTCTKEELGFGHIYRCVNLAASLGYHNVFFLLEDYGSAKKILTEKGYHSILLEKNLSINSELKKTILHIRKKKIDILIIDRYNISERYVSAIRRYVTTVLISDLLNLDYDADLLINGFIGLKNQIKKNQYGSKCLLGPKYQILDRKFTRPQVQSNKKFKLLITFGGFDRNNIIKIILRLFIKTALPIKTKIILGPGTPLTNEIKVLSQRCKYLQIKQKTNDMRKEILDAQFGICSGGITTYEFAALKTPFAIVCQTKHQLFTAKKWQEKGVALNLGFANKNIEKKLEEILSRIAGNRVIRLRKTVVDGHGSQRVAKEIIKLSKSATLKAK